MKFLLILLFTIPTLLFSQEWDDSYWEKVKLFKNGKEIDFINYKIFDAKCFDDECIMVLNNSYLFIEIFKSTDGGENWVSIYDNSFDFSGEVPEDFLKYNPRIAEIRSLDEVIITYDDKNGIINKFSLNTFENDISFKLNTFSDIKNLYTNTNGYGIAAYGIQYYITKDYWKTADFYKTHSIQQVMVTENNLFCNSNTNPSDTISLFNRSENGKDWEQYKIGKGYIDKLYAYDNNLFWAGGIKLFSDKSIRHDLIYNSTDGGQSWNLQLEDSIKIGSSVRDIMFLNTDIGIALTGTDEYYTTTNGGNNWVKQYRKHASTLLEINKVFLSNNYLFQFVGRGGLYKYNLSLLNITSVPIDDYKFIQTYPNPFTSNFTLSAENIVPDSYSLKIYTVAGDLILSKEVDFIGELEINTNFQTGSYYLIMENEKNHYIQKLIKE